MRPYSPPQNKNNTTRRDPSTVTSRTGQTGYPDGYEKPLSTAAGTQPKGVGQVSKKRDTT